MVQHDSIGLGDDEADGDSVVAAGPAASYGLLAVALPAAAAIALAVIGNAVRSATERGNSHSLCD